MKKGKPKVEKKSLKVKDLALKGAETKNVKGGSPRDVATGQK